MSQSGKVTSATSETKGAARSAPLLYWPPIAAAAVAMLIGLAIIIPQLPERRGRGVEAAPPSVAGAFEPASGATPRAVEVLIAETPAVDGPMSLAPVADIEAEPRGVAKAGPEAELTAAKPDAERLTLLELPVAAPRAELILREKPLDIPGIKAADGPLSGGDKACGDFGTAVNFARNMLEAGEQAKKERKLLFLLHVSGDFEDTAFT